MSEFEFGLAPARTREGGPRKRSETQQKYDELVVKLVKMWKEAGRPTASFEKPCAYIVVGNDEDYENKTKLLRSAATHLGVSVRFYDSIQGEDGVWRLPVSAENKREYKPRKKAEDSATGE